MDLVSKLNDRTLSFPSRCSIAASLLKPSPSSTWLFPRKNQYLFDWFTGSLLKLAKTDAPKAEIFLDKEVWGLMKEFALILHDTGNDNHSGKLKRRISFITDDEEFFDVSKCFDSQVFVIKCPLLSIFQTTLSLLNCDTMASESVCSVILLFLQQNRVSLPVSFSQVTEFIRSLVKCKATLPSKCFNQVLRPTLVILSEIVLGGGANYKKTYPLLVKFCVESAEVEVGHGDEELKEIWIDFIKKCLFSAEFNDELLTFLTCPSLISAISKGNNEIMTNFPKSLTFQKVLFIELATNTKAVESCPIIYESFLRAIGSSKITRETGFNFFTFLLRKTLPNNLELYATQLTKLISIICERGNEIYQQRNDEIYRNQSVIIEEIFNWTCSNINNDTVNSTNDDTVTVNSPSSHSIRVCFPLLLSLAKLNYYLVVENLDLIFSSKHLVTSSADAEVIEFLIGIFELAALANQLPVLLEILMKAKLSVEILRVESLQTALIKIFNSSLSPISLHEIYLSLIKKDHLNDFSLTILVPVIRSIVKIVDNVDSFDKDLYLNLQRRLLSTGNFNVLAEIVRWSPGTYLLIDELFTQSLNDLNLIFTLKCKDTSRISCKSLNFTAESFDLILKYLPIVADDMKVEELEKFCSWLLRNDENICIATLKMMKFYEIKSIRKPFINELVKFTRIQNSAFINDIIQLLPWEYLTDEMVVGLIKNLWKSPSAVSNLLKLPSPLNVRKETIKILISSDLTELVNFLLFACENDDLVSKCFAVTESNELIKAVLVKLNESKELEFKIKFVAKMLKFYNCNNGELISFIETEINPVEILKKERVTIEVLDCFDVILEWLIDYKMELVASSILALPSNSNDKEISIRCQALKCKFPSRTDSEFINESVELASKLPESPVTLTFKKDLLSLLKELPNDRVKGLLESFISADLWKFALALQALNQLLHHTTHIPTAFALFNDNLELIYGKSLEFNVIPSFLAVLKSIIQLKKNVTWESKGISNILGVLRRARQAQPQCYDEIFIILRLIVTLHLRQFKQLLPLLVANICEAFSGVSSVEESTALGRILSELGALRRGELEPFALLPVLYAFISSKYPCPAVRKPLQLAMSNLMYHLGTKKQVLQLLSTALVVEHEHRVMLKSFIDEYNKFHKYSGRA